MEENDPGQGLAVMTKINTQNKLNEIIHQQELARVQSELTNVLLKEIIIRLDRMTQRKKSDNVSPWGGM